MPDAVFASCEEVKRMSPQAPSGTYRIRDPVDSASHYRAFCKFDSVGQAWTLVLKVDGYLHGTKDSETSRFFYDDPLWVDTEVYNEDSLNTDEREAKLLSYLKASVQFVRLEFVETNTSANVLDLDLGSRYANLRTVILRSPGPVDAGAVGLSTKAGKAQWLSLVAGATLQPFCLREGFSVIGADSTPSQFDRVRIGIVGNENGAGDCNSPNSYLGVGGLRGSEKACSPKSVPSRGVSAGFVGGIGVEDDGKAICAEAQPSRRAWSAAFAYVYVR
jgi:hypothetical protein